MSILKYLQMSGLALLILSLYLLIPLPVQAEEPGWRQVSSGLEGGTIIDLAISPDFVADGLLLAVVDNNSNDDRGRLFRLVDGRWQPVFSDLAYRTVKRVTFSPMYSTDRKIFAATKYDGIFVSQDAGQTWTQINDVVSSFWALQPSPNYAVDKTIYAGGFKALYRMKDDGSSLTQLASGILLTDTVRSLVFSPDFLSDDTIFAGTSQSGVVRSIDGGSTWHSVGLGGLNVNGLVAVSGNSIPTTIFAGVAGGVYRSVDLGDTWEMAGSLKTTIVALAVSPNYANDKRLFVGTNFGGVYTSTDGGDNWTQIDDPLLPKGAKSIALHPDYTANQTLYVGQSDSLGVIVSQDAGTQWETMNSELNGLSVGDLFIWSNLADQTALFARAYPVGIYRSDDHGASWQSSYGNGLPKASFVQGLAISPRYGVDKTLFLSIQYNGVFRSIDGGLNWQNFDDPTWNSFKTSLLVISPAFQSDSTVFVGIEGLGIFRTTDRGVSWESVYEVDSGVMLRGLAISPNYHQDSTIFASDDSTILLSNNRGDSWVPTQSGLPGRRYSTIAVPPNFGQDGTQTLFAVPDHSNVLYRSTDGGVNWEALENRFPKDSQVNAIVYSPDYAQNGTMYAGLDRGVYVSTDKGENWNELQGGVPVWNVVSLAISQGLAPKLYAGTDGGSVWQYDIAHPSPNLSCDDTITGSVTLDGDLQCNETALTVNAPTGATIDCAGHTLTGAYPTVTSGFGIQVIGSTGVTIRNCTIRNFKTGVAFQGSRGNTLINSTLRSNGIGVWMVSVGRAGSEQMSTDNVVSGNLLALNDSGLMLSQGADRNRLIGNTVQNSTNVGIDINSALHTLISGNSIHGTGALGISLLKSDGMTLTANSVLSHTIGVSLNGNGGLFTGNTWRNNGTGLEVVGTSANNLLYNNYFSNPVNVTLEPSVGVNVWNVAQSNGPNLIGGPSIGGNFWGGSGNGGFSQTCADTPPNGFCDTSNLLGNNNQDDLPLAALTGLADCTSGPQWTVLVYLNGDNNLEFWTEQLFNRLELIASNPCLQIVALWDRNLIGDSNRYWVQGDSNPYGLAAYVENVNLWPYGELDMGNPQTLVNFVNWARSRFETPYTMLSIVGHGNGWSPSATATPLGYWFTGISFDDNGGGSSLSTNNLGTALGTISQNGADPIDLLYLDACLMAMAETLHPLRNFASFVVASENESFTSYPYDRYLGAVSSTTTPANLADKIVTEHHQSLPGYPRTLAAFDLSRMDAVTNAIDQLAGSLLTAYAENEQTLRTDVLAIFADVQKLDSNVDLLVDGKDGYVDLLHFARLVGERMDDAGVQAAAQSLQDALSGAPNPLIVNSQAESGVYGGTSWDLANATGLSIYLPLGDADWRVDFYNSAELSLAEATQWDEFVRTLTALDDSIRPSPLSTAYPSTPLFVEAHSVYLPSLNR